MNNQNIPMLLEPDQLSTLLGQEGLLVIDLSKESTHKDFHIPGAIHLDYGAIVAMKKPVGGLLPEMSHLSNIFSAVGLTEETHVVAYDDEGGGKACRLLWTLECIGHKHYSLLNGGLHAWANEQFPLSRKVSPISSSIYTAEISDTSRACVNSDDVMNVLDNEAIALLDVRSPAEFYGEKKYSSRGGHIPGAINIEWTDFMDKERNLRMKDEAEIRLMIFSKGIVEGQTVITYCQTHHRSAYSWFMLHLLGFDARGYHGSWSDWGNNEQLPIES